MESLDASPSHAKEPERTAELEVAAPQVHKVDALELLLLGVSSGPDPEQFRSKDNALLWMTKDMVLFSLLAASP